MRIQLVLFLILAQSVPAMAQDSYTFMVDRSFSSSVGAENLLTIHHLAYTLENKVLKTSWLDETSVSGKTLGVSYRLAKTVLLDYPVDAFTTLLQHEVYGHGSRLREYQFNDITYSFNPPFPYGAEQGMTTWNYPAEKPFSLDQDMSIMYGGVEATTILSRRLLFKWLERGTMNYRETLLYNRASCGLAGYLWLTKLGRKSEEGNDMLQYEIQINQREGYMDPSEYKLTVDRMAQQALVTGLDPFQYFSLYAFFMNYLWSAKESFEFPMIDLGRFKYLPSFRLGLTPFGSEIYCDNFFVRSGTVAEVYFRYGIPTFHRSWGVGFYGMNLYHVDPCSFDIGIDMWNQPAISISDVDVSESRGGIGGAMSCRMLVKVVESSATISVVGEMKAKTMGYLPGEPLRDALLLRAGLSLTVK